MKIIGLCGGSGAGKGEVGRILAGLGFGIIDTDEIYREMTGAPSQCTEALASEFGADILTPEGALDRKRLALLVFSGEAAAERRARLNAITHKIILDEARRRIEEFRQSGAPAAVVDAPLLFESGFDRECDKIVCVIASDDIRIARITKRDCIDEESAKRRISAQLTAEELKSRSDFVIVNDGDVSLLQREVQSVAEQILNN